ncbi:hypothetical protein ACP4OV_024286 [Aristida adscensionis]
MDAAAAPVPPKRKGAEAPEMWLDACGVPATKMRRLDAEVPPVAPGAAAPPPPFGVEEVLKRKAAEAPELWLDAGGGPATKMRRLDAEAPPVVPGAGAPPPPTPFVVEEVPMCGGEAAPGVAPAAANDERAIVVYQPAEAARSLLLGPLRPATSLRVNPDWLHGLKSTVLQEASNHRALFEALAARDENLNLALVPWAPSQSAAAASTAPGAETMDAEQDGDGASMEVEQDGNAQPAPAAAAAGAGAQGEAFHHHHPQQQQWPPQHCMALQQQLPAASYQPSPVTWSW